MWPVPQCTERGLSRAAGQPAVTGFSIGGVPPFGHTSNLPAYVDEDLTRLDMVWAATGTPFTVLAITPDDLVRASQGSVADLRREQLFGTLGSRRNGGAS